MSHSAGKPFTIDLQLNFLHLWNPGAVLKTTKDESKAMYVVHQEISEAELRKPRKAKDWYEFADSFGPVKVRHVSTILLITACCILTIYLVG